MVPGPTRFWWSRTGAGVSPKSRSRFRHFELYDIVIKIGFTDFSETKLVGHTVTIYHFAWFLFLHSIFIVFFCFSPHRSESVGSSSSPPSLPISSSTLGPFGSLLIIIREETVRGEGRRMRWRWPGLGKLHNRRNGGGGRMPINNGGRWARRGGGRRWSRRDAINKREKDENNATSSPPPPPQAQSQCPISPQSIFLQKLGQVGCPPNVRRIQYNYLKV